MSLEVLSTTSVSRLAKAVAKDPEIYQLDLQTLASKFSLDFVQTKYVFNEQVTLILPDGFSQDKNNDTMNCMRIHEMLPSLNAAHATDDRLWTTLSFGMHAHYLRKRWPFRAEEGDKLARHISNHWFCNNVRGRVRDNGIARLWWMGHIANRVKGLDKETVHEILFGNSDYRSSLLERNSSANALVVLEVILKLSKKYFDDGYAYKREPFRKFMRSVNFLGGRRNLASVTEEKLMDILEPAYREAYELPSSS